MTLEQEHYFAGFAGRPLRPRHRVAGLRSQRGRAQSAVALGGRRRRAIAICSSKFCACRRWRTAPRPLLLQHRAPARGRFRPRFYERLGLEDGAPIPEAAARARSPPASRRPSEAAAMRLAGQGRNLCLAGGLGLNALLVSALENHSGFENVFVQPVAGNAGTAIGAVLEAWHAPVPAGRSACALETLCSGPRLHRRRDQAGARELQAALPLPADHRRS